MDVQHQHFQDREYPMVLDFFPLYPISNHLYIDV